MVKSFTTFAIVLLLCIISLSKKVEAQTNNIYNNNTNSTSNGMMTILSLSSIAQAPTPDDPGGPVGCEKTMDGQFIVCATNTLPAKFSLFPFALVNIGYNVGTQIRSCSIYDTGDASTSLVFCASFINAQSMTNYSGILTYTYSDLTAINYVASPWG